MSTHNLKRQIVVVDDSSDWMDALEKLLMAYGEQRDIIKINREKFIKQYDEPYKFNLVDYCFVDLELAGFRAKEGITDMYGLTQILPHIRLHAPWIPAACVSIWISNDPKIMHELSVSDFDGLYPKELIGEWDKDAGQHRTYPKFNPDLWNKILRDLEIKRLSTLTGRSVLDVSRLAKEAANIKVTPSQEVRDTVYKDLGECVVTEAIAMLGLGGTKVSLNQIVTGFSGVYVIKAEVFGAGEGGSFRSKWLFKMGRSIGKLAQETAAHRRIFCRGINRSLIVGQLFPNPVIWKGLGVIAYGFEEDTLTALEVAKDQDITRLAEVVSKISKSLYASPEKCPCNIKEEVSRWIGKSIKIQEIVSLHTRTFVISRALIHGDLHLRNILISKGAAMLIDFARSEVGPIAIDAAKLAADTLVFARPDMLQAENIDWATLKKTDLSALIEPFDEYMKADDDCHAFNIFLMAFLRRYISYDDVLPETKKLIETALDNKRLMELAQQGS